MADDTTPCECGHSFNEFINNIDLKMYKSMKEKMHFTLHLMIHLTVQSRGAPEGTFERAPNDTFSNLHKDAQKGAFEVALKGALEVALGLHLWLHLLIQSSIYKFVQIGSFISIFLLFVSIFLSFQSNLQFFEFKSFGFRRDQYLLNSPSYFNS